MSKLMKNSISSDVKLYFEEIMNLQASGNDFPVNLDDVWPLVYSVSIHASVKDATYVTTVGQ